MASRDSQHPQSQQHGEEDKEDESFDTAALNQFDYFRLTLTDINGVGRCVSVPRRHVDHYLRDGVGFMAGTRQSNSHICHSGYNYIQNVICTGSVTSQQQSAMWHKCRRCVCSFSIVSL